MQLYVKTALISFIRYSTKCITIGSSGCSLSLVPLSLVVMWHRYSAS